MSMFSDKSINNVFEYKIKKSGATWAPSGGSVEYTLTLKTVRDIGVIYCTTHFNNK